MSERSVNRFVGQCLRKKPLREKWANQIIDRAQKEGTKLYKYHCPHCQHWHVTRTPRDAKPKDYSW